MKKVYYTWEDMERMATKLCRDVYRSGWMPHRVVGINRGGLWPGVFISQFMNIPHIPLDVRLRDTFDNNLGPESNCWLPEDAVTGTRTLIVDDINDTGATFEWIRDDWNAAVVSGHADWYMSKDTVRTASLIENLPSPWTTDYSAIEINKEDDPVWVTFPWEMAGE